MRKLLFVLLTGLTGALSCSCSESKAGRPHEREDVGSEVAKSSAFLAACSEGCGPPLSCVCSVCTIPCSNDEACAQYSGAATCALPDDDAECSSAERSCDVPCSHDGICTMHLGDDFICLLGRCRHEPLVTVDAGGDAQAGPSLVECEAREKIAAMCVLANGDAGGAFGNDDDSSGGTIVAIGEAEAHPECFGRENAGRAVPTSASPDEVPTSPRDTMWLRVASDGGSHVVGLAAPGIEALGIAVGDRISVKNDVSWGGDDWPFGNAELEIIGRGRVLFAINDTSRLIVEEGAAACERPGPCGGTEWTMRIDVGGQEISVAPFESVLVGSSTFTNAGALTHRREYQEPDEETAGTPGCKGEPRTNFVATRVDSY